MKEGIRVNNKNKSNGAVSLFIVLFTTLLITVITVGFIRIMLRDQQQASAADLSQSAYDSAQAGVEDGKRALLRYQDICASGTVSECADAAAKITSPDCNSSLNGIVVPSGKEVKVQEMSGANSLDQAYTCVKIALDTPNYLGLLTANGSKVIPLAGESDVNAVKIEWYSPKDLPVGSLDVNLPLIVPGTQPLFNQSSWPSNRPSIMRTQLMQFGTSFNLTDFDNTNAGQSNANTVFVYPTGLTNTSNNTVDPASDFINRDVRRFPTGKPLAVTCSGKLDDGLYACHVILNLPVPIGGGNRTAFLRLSSLYNGTNYQVTLLKDATPVKFAGVQPQIDSTGRANDLFRRVQSRVEMVDNNFPYPEAAVDITDNFCKDFVVTDNTADYVTKCTP